MSLPINYLEAYTGATVNSMEANGTVIATGDLQVSGKASVGGGLHVNSGGANILGRVQVGGSAADVGDVMLVKAVNISGNNTKRSTILPHGAHVIDIDLFVQTSPITSAGSQVDVMVGTSSHDTRFGRFANVSAQGHYKTATAQTSGWLSVSAAGDRAIVVGCTAISGAMGSGTSGKVFVRYIMPQ
jgi:hypothetical protein